MPGAQPWGVTGPIMGYVPRRPYPDVDSGPVSLCPACRGTGRSPLDPDEPCLLCGGAGRLEHRPQGGLRPHGTDRPETVPLPPRTGAAQYRNAAAEAVVYADMVEESAQDAASGAVAAALRNDVAALAEAGGPGEEMAEVAVRAAGRARRLQSMFTESGEQAAAFSAAQLADVLETLPGLVS